MSPAERQAIEWECARLIALYANLNDAHRWEDVVALYHPDGLMTRPTAPDIEIRGHEAILAAFKARSPRTTRRSAAASSSSTRRTRRRRKSAFCSYSSASRGA